MWEAVSYRDYNGYYSVELINPADQRTFWVDVAIVEKYHDVEADWNQYIFCKQDREDLIREAIQGNMDNEDEATGTAICYLESLGVIQQDDHGNWYDTKEAR